MPRRVTCIVFLLLAFVSAVEAQKPPVKLFIEAREKGRRNITLELTRDLLKSCPSLVSVTENSANAEVRLAIAPKATTLYRADGDVEHIFNAKWTVSGLTREICTYLEQR